jgi:hypothetical protein
MVDLNAVNRRLEEMYGPQADTKVVAEPPRRVVPFDGNTMMDDLAKDVLATVPPPVVKLPTQEPQKSYKPVEGIEPMAVTDILLLETHQQSHNQTNPVAECKFCIQEQEINKENSSNGNTTV